MEKNEIVIKNAQHTGFTRRIDDLGRIVIPKRIRVALGINEGDPVELYEVDGCVLCKPCSNREGSNKGSI